MMMMNSMLYSQPGTPIMYYGDEIGMATMPGLADRDGVRTAMQWSDAANGGFSKANPRDVSVSVNTDAKVGASRVNVAAQQADPESILSRTKAMLNARRGEPALQNGKLDIVETTNEGVVAYRRTSGNDQVIAIANLTGTAQTTKVQLAPGQRLEQVHGSDSFPSRPTSANDLELKPYEFQWLKLTTAS
jgi:maltose alpha-D-glucosyltransferase/alpha-amylase